MSEFEKLQSMLNVFRTHSIDLNNCTGYVEGELFLKKGKIVNVEIAEKLIGEADAASQE